MSSPETRPPSRPLSIFALNVRGQLARDSALIVQDSGAADILALTETWLGEGMAAPGISGYVAFNFPRPHSYQSGSSRGGIAVYVNREVAGHVSVHQCDCTNSFVVLRVSQSLGMYDKDLYLLVTYIAPRDSTVISMHTRALWEELEECVAALLPVGQVLVVGDQNARTGTLKDHLLDCEEWMRPAPTSAPRRNQDSQANWHGRKMVAMCKRTGMRIVNGRVCGDLEGAMTYVAPSGGASVIDYVLACPATMLTIHSLRIVPAAFSDHMAVCLQLGSMGDIGHSGGSTLGLHPAQPPRMHVSLIKAWCEKHLPAYEGMLAEIAAGATEVAATQEGGVHALCARFDRVLEASYPPNPVRPPHFRPKQPQWFDAPLARARRVAHAAMTRAPGSAAARHLQRGYQRMLRRKQRQWKRDQADSLPNLVRDNPRAFWRKFRPRAPVESRVSPQLLQTHFASLLGQFPPRRTQGEVAQSIVHAVSGPSRYAESSELEVPFTASDVARGIQGLRRGASTLGFLTVEALKAAAPNLSPCIAALFNALPSAGSLPPAWALSAITPIHKSGEVTDPGNYRGIAVGTVMARLYASLLNTRLTAWAESKGLRARGQAGFRADHRCSDQLMVLRTLVEQERVEKHPLYVCFVDFTKAYDSVPRDLLWDKLERTGVRGKFLQGIKALYASVPMAVKTSDGLSDSFEAVMGVKQGCPLSPTLFGLYLDDFELALERFSHMADLPSLSVQRVPALLYADDKALVSKSPEGLQAQMDLLQAYAVKWQLTVNVGKTKAMVFLPPTPGARQVYPLLLSFEGAPVEIVQSFKYLGVELHSTKGLSTAAECRMLSGERAQMAVITRCRQLGIQDPVLQMHLWDALVKPVLLYGVEMWGANDIRKGVLPGEILQRSFLRRLLGVRSGTPNMAVLAEVGRFPLLIFSAQLLCKAWNRMVSMEDDRLVKQAFRVSAALAARAAPGATPPTWAGQVAGFITSMGMPCDLSAPQRVDVKALVRQMEETYLASVTASTATKMREYLALQPSLTLESYKPAAYLRAVGGWKQRKRLAQLRTGSHWLAVETGRFGVGGGASRDMRHCQRCASSAVDDVEHMVFDCAALENIRLRHSSLFCEEGIGLCEFMAQDPTELAAFVLECYSQCES